jgi:hypothetical protein
MVLRDNGAGAESSIVIAGLDPAIHAENLLT